MNGRNRALIKSILERAMEEGRQGRVLEVQKRLKAAREIPEDHKKILKEIELFGRELPKSPFQMSLTIN